MVRLIRRYGGGSRKLYDTEESRYVSLEEIAAWVRAGQQVRVVDSAGGEDVTAQTLAQVIYESHKAGTALLSTDFLHDAIRRGSRALSEKVERLVETSVAKFPPARLARSELAALRESLTSLQRSVADLESVGGRPNGSRKRARRKS